MKGGALFVAVFLACAVEAVEATTIVLAAGTARNRWRSALLGVGAGLAVLGVVIAILGPAVTALPLRTLRLVVGGLLLIFGLQWLRKAILRGSGHLALHDEDRIYAKTVAGLQEPGADSGTAPVAGPHQFDGVGFVVAFKGVFLEGTEVVLIVISLGAAQHRLGLAALAAGAAVLLVGIVGAIVARQLSEVPENLIKTAVGIMLSSFGLFWVGEGAGVNWPGGDLAIPVLVAFWIVVTIAFTAYMKTTLPTAATERSVTR